MEEPLKVAVCEDTKSDSDKLLALLQNSSIPTQCRLFTSGEAFLAEYKPQQFDLLLTDIYMGGMTGVEMVTKVRQFEEDLPVAFITTSTDHTLEGYRLSVLRYIEKPFREKEVEDILKLARMERDSAPALRVQQNGKETTIRFSKILYLEQQTHHINIHLKDDSMVQVYDKLSALLPQLQDQGFFTPHKSYSVNLACVQAVDSELRCFVLDDGTNIPIRRESMSKAKKALADHLFSSTRGQE